MRLHPEIQAGGWAYNDEFVLFYLRVHCLLNPTMRVRDFGAGRGRFAEDDSDNLVARLMRLRGHCRQGVGFDVDPVVLDNPLVDRVEYAPPAARLPLADGSVDLIVSWLVFAHVAEPSL